MFKIENSNRRTPRTLSVARTGRLRRMPNDYRLILPLFATVAPKLAQVGKGEGPFGGVKMNQSKSSRIKVISKNEEQKFHAASSLDKSISPTQFASGNSGLPYPRFPGFVNTRTVLSREAPVVEAPRRARVEILPPVIKPKKSFSRLVGEILDHGGPGYLQFAITNVCNAKCDFCGFAVNRFDARQRRSVTLDQARDVIDICVENHIGYLLFVGGEPLVHPNLGAMIRYAAERGIHPMICTNGSLWTDHYIRALAADGLSSVIMSVDAHDVARHEENRGLPDVCRKIQRANEVFAELGVQTTASVTASRLIDNYDKLPGFLRALGFSSCTFSYPLTSLGSSYLSFSDSALVSYNTDELIGVFEKIKQMKRHSDFPVVNPAESLAEMQRHLRKEPERFGCLGGHKYFYLDWNLDLYRCHAWDKPMCGIYEFDQSKLIRDGCTKCMIDCYRDPSVLQFVAISASDAVQNLKKGRLMAAATNILDPRNLVSLRAVWENRKWIGKV
jgi:MoaA/NifB/PqqE/SkfB family radical SAM enzyme